MKRLIEWIERSRNWLREHWDIPYYKCYWLYHDIRCWMWHNFNMPHMRLVKEALCSYPFDFAYLYYLEKAKLQEMLVHFSRAKYLFPENYASYCRDISICIRLIDIFLEEEANPDVYINKRNWKRFMGYFGEDEFNVFFEKFPGILRAHKARHLYHKIRLYKTEYWWD